MSDLNEKIELRIAHAPVVSWAAEHCGVPLIHQIELINHQSVALRDARLELQLRPDLGEPLSIPLRPVEPGESIRLDKVDYRLPSGRLRQVVELERAEYAYALKVGDRPLLEGRSPVEVLPCHQWPGSRQPAGLLACFVVPNHPVVAQILKRVGGRLEEVTGSPSIRGYQEKSRLKVIAQVMALYEAIQALGLSYIGIPASFESTGQKVRLPDMILRDQMANCLDLTLLMASCLEQMGLHPLLILTETHAFPGVWLVDERFPEGEVYDAARLRTLLALGQILAWDSSLMVERPAPPFSQAEAIGKAQLEEDEAFRIALDVRVLRQARFLPLPIRDITETLAADEPADAEGLSHVRDELRELMEAATEETPGDEGDDRGKPAPRVADRFQVWKEHLLDLSLRNRLLNFKPQGAGALPLEVPHIALFEDLLADDRNFSLLPRPPQDSRDERDQKLLEARSDEAAWRAQRETDLQQAMIHCSLLPGEYWKRAKDLELRARHDIEEGGIPTLFAAIGILRWVESDDDPQLRHAPLLLCPVQIYVDRRLQRVRFQRLPEDPVPNYTLIEKMRRDCNVDLAFLASLEGDESGLDIRRLLVRSREAIQRKPRWEVLEEVHLGHFTFAKFLMWKDLEDNSHLLLENSTVRHLASQAEKPFPEQERAVDPGELDRMPPGALPCVLDADSTQMAAVASAARGNSFVLQGPPGTGKSQTIGNIIATSLAAGKTVLFVSEKMAALEVVHHRLRQIGLDDFCLELHSHKANRKGVLASFRKALEHGDRVRIEGWERREAELQQLRDELNAYSSALHRGRPLGMSLFQASGRALALRDEPGLTLQPGNLIATPAEAFQAQRQAVEELAFRAEAIEPVDKNPWKGTDPPPWNFQSREMLEEAIQGVIASLDRVEATGVAFFQELGASLPEHLDHLRAFQAHFTAFVAGPLPPATVSETTWSALKVERDAWIGARQDAQGRLEALASRWSDEALESGDMVKTALDELDALDGAGIRLCVELALAAPEDLSVLRDLHTHGAALLQGPLPADALRPDCWNALVNDRAAYLAAEEACRDRKQALQRRWTEALWQLDLSALHTLYGRNLQKNPIRRLVILGPTLYGLNAIRHWFALEPGRKQLKPVCRGPLPDPAGIYRDLTEALALLDEQERLRLWGNRLERQIAPFAPEDWKRLEEASLKVHRAAAALEPLLGAEGVASLLERAQQAPSEAWRERHRALGEAWMRFDRAWKAPGAWFKGERLGDGSSLRRDLVEILSLRSELPRVRALEQALAAQIAPFGLDRWDALQERASAFHQALQAFRPILTAETMEHLVQLALSEPGEPWTRLLSALEQTLAELQGCLALLKERLNPQPELPLSQRKALRQLLEAWQESLPTFRAWSFYCEEARNLRHLALDPVVEAHRQGRISAGRLVPAFERAFLTRWCAEVRDLDPALRRFEGARHHRRVEQFREMDREWIRLSRAYVVKQLESRLPFVSASPSANSEMGLLQREVRKKARHLPIRKLLQAIPTLLPRLKPCLLMSPLSVAQYLPADGPPFDLLVFDEASQITTHDAIGTLARGRQVIIVGDSRQLPPTTFFVRTIDEEAEPDENDVAELESILDEAIARQMPEQKLGWHYRSRHEALIEFSNRHYYEGRLHVFPSPARQAENLGISWHPVPDGMYYPAGGESKTLERTDPQDVRPFSEDRTPQGKSPWRATNPKEAQALVDYLAAKLLATRPGERSFGVVTFGMGQQRAVQEMLDERRAEHADLEAHFTGDEPVFVKNLENVQGDERDEILFSIGYARDPKGRLRMHFGPLSNAGGERRLNVAVTRARRQLRVFSTLTHDQIELSRTKSIGTAHLRAFLHYAAVHGGEEAATASSPRFDSFLEEDVCEAIRSLGYEVHTQVGCGGYRIDLGVVDPHCPGRYLLGVECDGLSYGKADTARDRDRLRHQILSGLGWRLLRVWSADWLYEREREIRRLESALKEAKTPMGAPDVALAPDAPAPVVVPREEPFWNAPPLVLVAPKVSGPPTPTPKEEVGRPYQTLELPPLSGMDPDSFYDPSTTQVICSQIQSVVEAEGPIHVDDLASRVLRAWGRGRVRERGRLRLAECLSLMEQEGNIRVRDDFLWPKGLRPEDYRIFRVPEEGQPAREAEHIPPEEAANAFEQVLKTNIALAEDELVKEGARLLGSKRVTSKTLEALKRALPVLMTRGTCAWEGGIVKHL